jgi:hypothetical protein
MKAKDKSGHETGRTADDLNPFRRNYFSRFVPETPGVTPKGIYRTT